MNHAGSQHRTGSGDAFAFSVISEGTGECFEAIQSPRQQQKTCPKYPQMMYAVYALCLCIVLLKTLYWRSCSTESTLVSSGLFQPGSLSARHTFTKLGRSCASLVVTHHWYQIGIPLIFALCILFRSGEQHTWLG